MATRSRLFALLATIAVIGVGATLLPVNRWLLAAVQAVSDAGPLAPLAYGGLYALAPVAMIPGSILSLGGGFLFGPWLGAAVVLPAATVGATAAFFLGRTFAREHIAQRVSGNRRFAAIDNAIGRDGLRLVILLRLSPVFPFVLLNYALGLTSVRPRHFVLGSLVGMAPGALVFTYLGSTLTRLSHLGEGAPGSTTAGSILYWGGLLATVAVVVVVTRLARRAIEEELHAQAH